MAENSLEIILTLQDELSGKLKEASKGLDKFASDMKSLGRDISQVGNTFAAFGAAVSAPFILALKNSSKTVTAVKDELQKLTNVADRFQEQIATAILPLLQQFTNVLLNLYIAFVNIPQPIRDMILQGTFLIGVFTALSSVIFILIGRLLILQASLAGVWAAFLKWLSVPIHAWILGTVAAVAILIALMFKFKAVADVVLSTFEILFLSLRNGFIAIKLVFTEVLIRLTDDLFKFLSLLERLPGITEGMVAPAKDALESLRETLRGMADEDINGIITNTEKMGKIFKTGEGEWSKGFENLKIVVNDTLGSFKEGVEKVDAAIVKQRFNMAALKGAVQTLQSALSGAAAENRALARAFQIVSIGMAIANTAEGVTRAFKDYAWPASFIVAALIGAAGAIQIATIAAQKFATGTDSVPAMLTPGEMVFPRTMSDAIRSGDIVVGGRGSGGGGSTFNITINGASMNSGADIEALAEQLGFEVERKLRRARTLA